jgi:hypothetical protein
MAKRSITLEQPITKAIRPIFKSNNVKGSFFLVTLLDTMDNIINNLSTRNILLFRDIKLKILNITKKYTINIDLLKVYAVRQTVTH